MKLSLSGLALATALCGGAAWAAEPAPADKSGYSLFRHTPDDQLRDMDTDRPNVTNTPHTIDAGRLQVEVGAFDFTRERDRSAGSDVLTDTLDAGVLNFRLGVTDRLELNAVVTSFSDQRTKDRAIGSSQRSTGFGDLVVGAKLNLWGDDGADGAWSTALALQPQLKLPTAAGDLGNGHAEFSVLAPLQVNLPGGAHLGLQGGLSALRDSRNTGYVAGWQSSIALDRTLIAKADVYVEYAVTATSEHRQPAQQTADVGFTYPVGKNLVFDTGLAFGLTHASPTIEWQAGFSKRF